jgi:RNA polymerase primary sigma factor
VRVHTLKSDYESTHGCGLTKKEWASLADIDTATLRQVVANYRWAKQELVSSNMGLVHGIAREFARRNYKKLTLEELIQEGSLGLLRAAELFDPKKGLRFSTYATIWIKGALQNTRVGEFVVLPPAEKKVWRDIQSVVKDRKKGKNNKELDTQTIASTLGMKPHKVETNIHKMTSVANVLSLDYQYTSSSRSGYDYGTKTQESFLKDESLAEQTALKADIVTALVSNLTPQEITLIRLIYGLYDGKEYTIKDSAEILGMNRETTRLLHKSCLRKLREAKEMESLQEYLLTVA